MSWTAREMGMQAVRFESYEQARAAMDDFKTDCWI